MRPDDYRIEELLRASRPSVVRPVSHPELCNDPDMLAAYAEGALSAVERDRLQAHLATCDACREAVVRLVRLAPDQSAAGHVSAPAVARAPAPRFRWIWAAPALAGVALIGSFVYMEHARYTGLIEQNRAAAVSRAGDAASKEKAPAAAAPAPPPASAPAENEEQPAAAPARPESDRKGEANALAKKVAPEPDKPQERKEDRGEFSPEAQSAKALPPAVFDARTKDEAKQRDAGQTIGGPVGGLVIQQAPAAAPQAAPAPPPPKAQADVDQNKRADKTAQQSAGTLDYQVEHRREMQQMPSQMPPQMTANQAPSAPRSQRQQSAQGKARDDAEFAPVPGAQAPATTQSRAPAGVAGGAQPLAAPSDSVRLKESGASAMQQPSLKWWHALPPGARKSLLAGGKVFVLNGKRELLSGMATGEPSWQKVELPSRAQVADVGVAGQTVWVLFVDGCVTRSPDTGGAWSPATCVLSGKQTEARSIRVQSATSARVYARDGWAFETTDAGATWTAVQP